MGLGKLWKKARKFVLPTIGALLAPMTGGASAALGAAVGSGVAGYMDTKDPLAALLSAGGSYIGSNIGSSLFPQTLGDASKGLGITLGQSVPGDAIGNAIGSLAPSIGTALANASVGGFAGGILGSNIGDSLYSVYSKNPAQSNISAITPASVNENLSLAPLPQLPPMQQNFTPSRQKDLAEDDPSFKGFAALNPLQRSTNIATQGVFGGGAAPQEQKYFMNLINRRLVDDNGSVADLSELKPIEQSYLQMLGLGGYGNTRNLLEAMQRWKPA